MKKKSWDFVCIGFAVILVGYLFIYCNALGVMVGWVAGAYEATRFHLTNNTALSLLIICYIIYNELRRL